MIRHISGGIVSPPLQWIFNALSATISWQTLLYCRETIMPVQLEKIGNKIAPCRIVQILVNTIKFHHIHVRHRGENYNSNDDDEDSAISVHYGNVLYIS
jgi:hypothetical protein